MKSINIVNLGFLICVMLKMLVVSFVFDYFVFDIWLNKVK